MQQSKNRQLLRQKGLNDGDHIFDEAKAIVRAAEESTWTLGTDRIEAEG